MEHFKILEVMICTYLCISRQIGDGHFERFQDSHGPLCSVIKHIPHTCLQHVGLRGCLGNSHTHLNEKRDVKQIKIFSVHVGMQESTNQKDTVHFLSYTGAEVVDGLRGKPASPQSSEGEEAWVVPVSTKTAK